MKKIVFVLALVLAGLAGGTTLITSAKADGHTDMCQANLDQCLKACDGMASCSDQCTTNYNGCVGQ